jgi:hypothetical protein
MRPPLRRRSKPSGTPCWPRIEEIVGNNGIARHILTGETESEGKTNAIKIGVLMVWLKQDAR